MSASDGVSCLQTERLLIIDDHHQYATLLCTMLTKHYGLTVECVYTAQAGRRRLQADPPISLLIIDEDLAGQSGAQLIATTDIPATAADLLIVVHSLYTELEIATAYAACATHFDCYIEKPIAIRMLIDQLTTCVCRRRTHTSTAE